MFRAMAEYVDQDKTGDFRTLFKNTQDCKDMESQGNTYKNISEDLYILLVDKTEGEAMVRLRGCPHGDGVSAYMAIYKWFTGASEQATAERIRKMMSPSTPKGEQDIADAMDRWIESARTLENMKPEYKLQDPFKVTALESLMSVGQGKIYFENLKAQGLEFEEILAKCKDYAIRRRLDHAHKKHLDDLDIGAVQTRAEMYQDRSQERDTGGNYLSLESHGSDGDVDIMSKKGKEGDKGFQGARRNRGYYGHRARECGRMNPFQGMCTEGSQWGHRAKECRVGGRIPEIGQDAEENEEGHGDDHRHVAILERDGSICATDKNWGKGEDGCLANADEWTQVKRRGVSGSPRSKHLSADMLPSRGWACAPQRKTLQVSQ